MSWADFGGQTGEQSRKLNRRGFNSGGGLLVKFVLTLVVLLALIFGGYYWYAAAGTDTRPNFRTAEIKRGDVRASISATGTIEPEELVDVGAQVAGRIESLGKDPDHPEKSIDYGSNVKEGTILAQIDDSVYAAQVEQAEATLARAKADLLQLDAKKHQTERDFARFKELKEKGSATEADYDLAEANARMASAALEVGKATAAQNAAMLNMARINLGYTTIKSPVHGVIIDRRVNVGQTVVSSLNAPSLFLIAKDLNRLQVWASVNEADIGRILKGQPVRFTFDTFPDKTFLGAVEQIRLNATMTQNVVTYTVVVSAENPDGKLLPYLTANLQFEMDFHADVLLVPTVALRWQPKPELIAPEFRPKEPPAGSTASPGAKKGKSRGEDKGKGTVWVRQGNFVKPIPVTVGLTDGLNTEVSGDGVQEGMELVVGEIRQNKSGEASNPFAPKMFGPGAAPAAGGGRGGG